MQNKLTRINKKYIIIKENNMNENEKNIELSEENKEESVLLSEYKKLQANTVSKDKYEKDIAELKEKNKLYLNAITEGQKVDIPSENKDVNVVDAINDISKFRGTNLEYWQKMTTTIDKVLQTLPDEEITRITGTDGLEEIVKVNENMKKMVEDSKGDSDYFRTLYKARVTDSAPKISAEIEKSGSLLNYFNNKNK